MKIKSSILFFASLCLCFCDTMAQSYGYNAFSSCGSVALNDQHFAIFNNPSQLCNAKPSVSYTLTNPYSVGNLYVSALNLQTSVNRYAYGVFWKNEGNNAYHKNVWGFGTAMRINPLIQIGMRAHWMELGIKKYGHTRSADIDLSITSQVHSKLKSAFVLNNLFQYKRTELPIADNRTSVAWGLSYALEKRIYLQIELVKQMVMPAELKAGLTIQKDSLFKLNLFESHGGQTLGLGLGFKKRKTELGFAFAAHILLGFSTCISLSYEIKS